MSWWSGSSSNKKTRITNVNTVTAAAALTGCAAAEDLLKIDLAGS